MNNSNTLLDCYGVATVGEDGEIVLPADVLLRHGLRPGGTVQLTVGTHEQSVPAIGPVAETVSQPQHLRAGRAGGETP